MSDVIIGAPVSDALAKRTDEMIKKLRNSPDDVPRGDVIDLVMELTDASFHYHFVRPLEDLGVGFATRKAIQVGLNGASRAIRTSMQRVVKSLDDKHYPKLAELLDDAYYPNVE